MGIFNRSQELLRIIRSPTIVLIADGITNFSAFMLAIFLPLALIPTLTDDDSFVRIGLLTGVYIATFFGIYLAKRKPAFDYVHNRISNTLGSKVDGYIDKNRFSDLLTGAILFLLGILVPGLFLTPSRYSSIVDNISMLLFITTFGAVMSLSVGLMTSGVVLIGKGKIRYADDLVEAHAQYTVKPVVDEYLLYEDRYRRFSELSNSPLMLQILDYLDERGESSIGDLRDKFEVEDEAIRIELKKLKDAELVDVAFDELDRAVYTSTVKGRSYIKRVEEAERILM